MAAINKFNQTQDAISSFEGDYFFLSNFYPSPIVGKDDGIEYPTVEHYFQAHKTTNMEDRIKIAGAKTPGMAKRAGRAIDLRPDWEKIKVGVMFDALSEKFKNPDLQTKLIATGNKRLIEGNFWHDNFWGACRCEKCAGKTKRNQLGSLLIKVRQKYGGSL